MLTPNVLRLVAALAPGKHVTVVTSAGVEYRLPIEPEAVPPAAPHPIEVLSQQLLERDAEMRAAVESVAAVAGRADERTEQLQGLVRQSIDGQKRIVDTLMLPVVPTKYDAAGRLIEARRKEAE